MALLHKGARVTRGDITANARLGVPALGAFVINVLASESSDPFPDYDSLIGFGLDCADALEDVDAAAIAWAAKTATDAALDVANGFLEGYWSNEACRDRVTAERLASFLDVRDHVTNLSADAATGSVRCGAFAIESNAIPFYEKRSLARRLLAYAQEGLVEISASEYLRLKALAGSASAPNA